MPTRNVHLTEHFDQFIDRKVSTGRFSNASEIVREGLRLLEQREREDEAKIEWLRSAAREGFDQLDSGDSMDFNSVDDLVSYIEQVGAEVSQELASTRARG
jgi:antitoxin ParD1/3/4